MSYTVYAQSNEQPITLTTRLALDWLQSFKQFFINVSYHIFVASLTLMALFEA